MSFIRHRQRVITAVNPHQGNSRYIVPKRSTTITPPTTWQTVQSLVAEDTGARGYFEGSYGTLTPNTIDNTAGDTIERIITFGTGTFLELAMAGVGVPDADTTFSQIQLGGIFEGGINVQTYARTDATFYDGITGGRTRWRIPITANDRMIGGNTYTAQWDGDL